MRADQPSLRLSDDERQETLDALAEHVRTGRLDIDEFGDRSAQATSARLRGDVVALFTDLPEPRPSFLLSSSPVLGRQGALRRLPPGVLPVAGVALLVVLVLVLRGPAMMLLVPVALVLAALWLLGGRRGS